MAIIKEKLNSFPPHEILIEYSACECIISLQNVKKKPERNNKTLVESFKYMYIDMHILLTFFLNPSMPDDKKESHFYIGVGCKCRDLAHFFLINFF